MRASRGSDAPPRMARIERALMIGQPVLLVIAIMLARWSDDAAPIQTVLRPMLVVIGLAALSLGMMRLVARSWPWAALVSSALMLFTLREVLPALVIATAAVAWLLLTLALRLARYAPPPSRIPWAFARATGIFSLVLLVVMTVLAARAADLGRPELQVPHYASLGTSGPNIYVVLLDGYPRADTLQQTFGIDIDPFLDQLAELDFAVSAEARTNYNKTWLTLASALNGAYIEDLVGDVPSPAEANVELRWLHALINEASILDPLRDRGYAIRTVPPPYTSAALTTADDYLDMGRLTEFEVKLIGASPWTFVLRDQVAAFLFDAQREQAIAGLETTARLAESRPDGAQFVLSHIHSPHTPFVLGPAPRAEHAPVADCFPLVCTFWEARLDRLGIGFGEYETGLRNQIDALNTLVLTTVRRITVSDPDAVVILMSDHGARYSLEDLPEHYRSFLAARTPGADDLYPPDESPVNIFRRLLSVYFEADTPPLPYRAWTVDWAYNLRLTEMPLQ